MMNNYYKKYVTIVFLLFCSVNIYSQKIDNDTLIYNIKKDVTSFFIKQNVIEKNIVGTSLNYVFVIEIVKGKVIGYDLNGIYSIGVYQSHSKKHILIKDGDSYIIFNLEQIDLVLKEVLDYSLRNKLDNVEMLFYIKSIIQRYEDNYIAQTSFKNK